MRRVLLLLLVLAASLALGACGGDGSAPDEQPAGASDGKGGKVTVYSGRAKKLVGPLLEDFERRSGIDLDIRYGESAELAATLAEEGDSSPADVFFSQDAGALGAVAGEGLLAPLPKAVLGRVDERFRDPAGQWVGTSGRARVVAYSTKRLKAADLPASIFDFADPKWKGRIGLPPSNASFQAFISAMRIDVGDDRTREWLEAIKRNEPKLLENNIQTEEAIDAGEIDVGFVNHYYLYELRAERPGFAVDNHFLEAGDPGSLVNVAGAAVMKDAGNAAGAAQLIDFLLSARGQRFFAEKTFEYPLLPGADPPAGLRPLDGVQGPKVALGELGGKLRSTLELLSDTGFGA